MTSCCLQKSEVKNYNEMHCTWVDAISTFFPPLACFPALCRVAYCKFSRPFSHLFFSALGTGRHTTTFPALSTSYFLCLIYGLQRLHSNIRSVKCFPSHRKRFTDLFYLSVLNTWNKNLHSNAKSVLAEDLSSCFFNDPSLSFWWAIRSLLQSFKIESESVKES